MKVSEGIRGTKMTKPALAFLVFLAGFYFCQAYLTVLLTRAFRTWKRARLMDEQCPRVAVVLCLRGNDPFLPQCIDSVLRQDYPDYEVRLVIDHETDPCVSIVEAALEGLGVDRAHVDYLRDRRATCSLKCSSLSQAVANLDESFEVVALLDADTVPHETWLRELVAPLQEQDVAAATGHRWYVPENPTVGTMARYIWNSAAIIQMHAYNIAWGGTLAIRHDVIRELDLPGRWQKAFCEDTMLYGALRERNLKLSFVPSLVMVSRESCDLGACFHWVCRQLLTARLYHPGWPAVVLHAFVTAAIPAVAIGLLSTAVSRADWLATEMVSIGICVYCCLLAGILQSVRSAIGPIVADRGKTSTPKSAIAWLNFVFALVSLQVFYPIAVLCTLFSRSVDWRGVTYRIGGSWDIQMLEYGPYETRQAGVGQSL